MENDKIRKLLDQYARSSTLEGRAYAEKKIQEQGLTLGEVYQMVQMENPYLEACRLEGTHFLSAPVHSHDFGEIICCTANCGMEYLVDGDRYRLQRGDIVVIPPGIAHACLVHGEREQVGAGYMLWVGNEYIRIMAETYPHFRFTGEPVATMIRTAGTPWENV